MEIARSIVFTRPKLVFRNDTFFVFDLIEISKDDLIVLNLSKACIKGGLSSAGWSTVERFIRSHFAWREEVSP